MAEIELSILSRQCTHRRIANKKALASEVSAWQKESNHVNVQINWQFKPDHARIKLKRLYPVAVVKTSS